MALLDELRQYLEQPRTAFVPDVAAHRKHLVLSLARLEQRPSAEQEVERIHADLSDRLETFATLIGDMLLDSFCRGETANKLADVIDVAIDREIGLDTTTGSRAKDMEVDRIRLLGRRSWRIAAHRDRVFIDQYALEIRAVKRDGAIRVTTPIGRMIVDLPPRDALRWVLAAEVAQSHGATDPLRLSSSAAAALLDAPAGEWDMMDEDPREYPVSWATMERLSKLGLVFFDDTGRGTMQYGVLDEGRPLLEEIASGKDTPFILLARALLQDETHAVIGRMQPGVLVQSESSAAATARHARMVAHEIRNALVPVQSSLEALYRDADRRGVSSIVEEQRDAIDSGIARVFRFLRDIARIADLASASSELFDVTPAVQDAVAVIASDLGRPISFEPVALPAVRGNRDRLVLAVVNILRNAAQSRSGGEVTIRVSAGTNNGAEVFIAVDDDGPGVPPEHRANVFEPGFSLRPDGTGQGLSLVREVVETEMAGRAVCEGSQLGGARFVIRLPVGTRRNG